MLAKIFQVSTIFFQKWLEKIKHWLLDVFNKNLDSFLWPFLNESCSNRLFWIFRLLLFSLFSLLSLFSRFRLPKRILATVNWALHPYLRSAKQEAQSYKNKEGEKKGSPHQSYISLQVLLTLTIDCSTQNWLCVQ